jgi:hypothetical protein
MPVMQVSSSSIRRRVRERLPIRYLVPDKVASYIGTNGLYGPAKPEPTSTSTSTSKPVPA